MCYIFINKPSTLEKFKYRMHKEVQKGTGNDKQGKDAGNHRKLCPYRNFSQAIIL